MRTTKELLEVMLENIDSLHSGLCHLTYLLRAEYDIIEFSEYEFLGKFLEENLPVQKYTPPDSFDEMYSFPYGEKQPRIDWLKQQIEKLEQTK
jgi:hypothetical protein